MTSPLDGVQIVRSSYNEGSVEAYELADCSNCAGQQMAVIARRPATEYVVGQAWLRCIACYRPHVRQGNRVTPSRSTLVTPDGLEDDVAAAWREVQSGLAQGAYTSAVMMCRKIVLHVAVAVGLAAKNDKDRAPTFAQALDHLVTSGTITPVMHPWAKEIVDVGNEANHELAPVSKAGAERVATFTLQLLVLHYEMAHRMAKAGITPGGGASPSSV